MQVTIPKKSIDMIQGISNPTEIGDVAIISGSESVVLDACDSVSAWSVVSGSPTLAINSKYMAEGAGCLEVTVPKGSTVVIRATFSSKNISLHTHIKLYLKQQAGSKIQNVTAYFGESAYNEQSYAIGTPTTDWRIYSWDISAISASSRDGVTLFGIMAQNTYALLDRIFYIDYVWVTGASKDEIKTVMPTGAIRLYFRNKIETGLTELRYVSSPTTRATQSLTPVKLKEARIKREGSYNISYYATPSHGTGCYFNIYKNGTAIGTQRQPAISTNYTETISFVEDNLVQIYAWVSASPRTATVENFYVDGCLDFCDLTQD